MPVHLVRNIVYVLIHSIVFMLHNLHINIVYVLIHSIVFILHNLHINIVYVLIHSIIFMLHNLHIIDHGNRLCNICTDADIGDEFHYILQCEYLANEKILLESIFFTHNQYFEIWSIISN